MKRRALLQAAIALPVAKQLPSASHVVYPVPAAGFDFTGHHAVLLLPDDAGWKIVDHWSYEDE